MRVEILGVPPTPLYEAAFETGQELIYVAIMSKRTLKRMPECLRRAEKSGTTLNVLTWDPAVGSQAIRAFARHLGEETTSAKQIEHAFSKWKQLARSNPSVIKEARGYKSGPPRCKA